VGSLGVGSAGLQTRKRQAINLVVAFLDELLHVRLPLLTLGRFALQITNQHQLLAPTLLRSQLLSVLYRAVRQGEMTKQDADGPLTYARTLQIRLLGDRVLQCVAWKLAEQLGWPDTLDAEYVALTQLQADALMTPKRWREVPSHLTRNSRGS
jgi:hypothetical protein